MPYARFDDGLHSDPQACALSDEALGLLTRAHTWIADYLTDGWIEPAFISLHVQTRKRKRVVEELVDKGWWQRKGDRYYSVTYLQDNPCREEVEERLSNARKRKQDFRRRRAQGQLPWTDGDQPNGATA